ncbi:outer membrane protein assembly factor BamD [Helicobacter pylori]|uniref:outer membrane protein assembly factor BamD n=1 Tax=Helicobacter pylori TaxID=210 RepID=UPI0012E8B214|nr:outer membrane protein assembly factor BamD [Helicobacter pylori]MUU30968.1 outer membrane protein assembly factor BamD [Helicobacter pylori]
MRLKHFKTFLFITMAIIVIGTGCANKKKKKDEYNKPAIFWYQGILREILFANLETADNYYSSLQSEHINSPLVPEAMLALGQAHMKKREYVLASFYFDEYIKRFGTKDNVDYLTFLKLQSHYYAFKNHSKDQEFISNSIVSLGEFIEKYPNSRYRPYVEYMQIKFILGQNELNRAIANVYKKRHKPEGVKRYLERIDEALEKETKPKPSHMPWYVLIFDW